MGREDSSRRVAVAGLIPDSSLIQFLTFSDSSSERSVGIWVAVSRCSFAVELLNEAPVSPTLAKTRSSDLLRRRDWN